MTPPEKSPDDFDLKTLKYIWNNFTITGNLNKWIGDRVGLDALEQPTPASSELVELASKLKEAQLDIQRLIPPLRPYESNEIKITKEILTLILKRNVNKINILQQTRDKTTRFENIREELADTLLLGGIEELEEANVEIRKCLSILQGDKNDPK